MLVRVKANNFPELTFNISKGLRIYFDSYAKSYTDEGMSCTDDLEVFL